MVISRPWKSLNVTGDFPLLFLKAQIDNTRCHIQLTDLNRLWAVSWNRKELVQSARRQGTSIDPSEDDAQYEQFVSKVGSALEGERPTTLNLEPAPTKGGLDLTVSAPLPGSLPIFKWTISLHRLESENGSAFEADVLTPLLVHANNLRSRIQFLVDELGHKDRVIAKVADKLENVGQDLTQVFPGASKSGWNKKVSRKQLAKHVDGLSPFDTTAWQAESTKAIDQEDPSVESLDTLLAEMPDAGLLSAHKDTVGSWWLPRGENVLNDDTPSSRVDNGSMNRHPHRRVSRRTASPPILSARESSIAGEDFQRQTTPPVAIDNEDEETEDDDDLDAGTYKPSRVETTGDTPVSSQSKDVGVKPAESVKRSEHPAERQSGFESASNITKTSDHGSKDLGKSRTKLGAFGGARKSETPTPELEPEVVEPLDSPPAQVKKVGRKLGGFGGSAKRKTPEAEPGGTSDDSTPAVAKRSGRLGVYGGTTTEPQSATVSLARIRTRLGAFGGKAPASSQAPEQDDTKAPSQSVSDVARTEGYEVEERPSRALQKVEDVEQERERSEERADKRRDKLKADIAERSKEPVKKKRRF
ncbi:Putative XRCC4-like domain superfamily protein [Septoria linicola]|uniref:Non-homologous end-joining factor 1 n=1 Tax=Septoria linicola TaxID=215465 RepID=A0A9Q9ELY4_9PEZI|nr:Putative XRCC4-like domain superfamily protein [Septoria linicola]